MTEKEKRPPLTTTKLMRIGQEVLTDLFNARDLQGVQVSAWHDGDEVNLRIVVKIQGKKRGAAVALDQDDLRRSPEDIYTEFKEIALRTLFV